MSKKIDIIGIGAINYDFIFNNASGKKAKKSMDDGEETFVSKERFKNAFDNANKNLENNLKTQIGGSALLAIKTIKEMSSDLKTGYVGVYGQRPSFSKDYNFPKGSQKIDEYLSTFIDDTSWLFSDQEQTGSALVMLQNHKRDHINIYTGANNKLQQYIQDKGESKFISYLASAKWIHMSSLQDIDQFCHICDLIEKAKEINPYLTLSIDPGFDYTKNHWDKLKLIFHIADFVFLSKIEKDNIWNYLNFTKKDSFSDFGQELININANPQIIVIKNVNNIILLNLITGMPFIRKYHHRKILKIANDTGAGDAFAGGFIAGMLSPVMLSYQPAPVQLGVNAAKERLTSSEWPTNLKHIAIDFKKKSMKEEKRNTKQLAKIRLIRFGQFIAGLVVGFASDLLIDFLVDLLK